MKDFYEWVRRHVPLTVRQVLKSLGVVQIVKRWDPRSDPSTVWSLGGVLTGHRMRFRRTEDFQYLGSQQYEPTVCTAIVRLIQPGWVCADVGAHIGYMTLLMAKLVGSAGRVFAFEAVQANAQLLMQNVELNGYEQFVVVENKAVSDGTQGTLTLFGGPSSFEATIVPSDKDKMSEVSAVALDNYFSPGERLDFIKIDIEGGETDAISGMQRLLSQSQPLVLLEIHQGGWSSVYKLIAAGYVIYDLDLRPVDVQTAHGCISHCIAAPAQKPLM